MLSEVAQTERLVSQVPYTNGYDINESVLRRLVGLSQIGAVEKEDQVESFCVKVEPLSQGSASGVLYFMYVNAACLSHCVR